MARSKPDGTRAETRFRLSPKWTSPFKSAGEAVHSTAGSRGVRISVSNAGCTTFRGSVTVLATHSICQFPPHFPRARHRVPSGFKRALLHSTQVPFTELLRLVGYVRMIMVSGLCLILAMQYFDTG